jgi:hypothetical protein
MQWGVSIGRLDITTTVMTLSSFRAMPRCGHLDHVKRVYGYLSKMKEGIIRVCTDEPDYSGLPEQDLDWATSVHGNIFKILPTDAPTPLGKYVTVTHYFDANLYHDMLTGGSVTGLLNLQNKTPIDWYSKKQATVETATCRSRQLLRLLPTDLSSLPPAHVLTKWLIFAPVFATLGFRSVIKVFCLETTSLWWIVPLFHTLNYTSSVTMLCHSTASMRLSPPNTFLCIIFLASSTQLISLPNTGYPQVWRLLQPLLFYQGDTAELFDD